MYEQLIRPISHLGPTDHVTAAEMRNCLSVLASFAGGPPAEITDATSETEPAAETQPASVAPAEAAPAAAAPAVAATAPEAPAVVAPAVAAPDPAVADTATIVPPPTL